MDDLEAAQKKMDARMVKQQLDLKHLSSAYSIWQKTKVELGKIDKIVLVDDTKSTAQYSAGTKRNK